MLITKATHAIHDGHARRLIFILCNTQESLKYRNSTLCIKQSW